MPAIAAIGAAIKIGGAIFGAGRAKREARRQRKRAKALNKKINHLEANRQDVINPYDQVTSLASMATDLSSTMSNPMANLSVATKAAEMKIEQADISLANTLDTLRATGAGAGGATALAQAALQSKKGVAADIEGQEKANEDKRAAGEERLEQRVAAEKQRIQRINISEGAREQQAFAQGRNIEFQSQENRDNTKLNRLYGQQSQAQGAAAAARSKETSSIMGGINALGGAISGGAFGGGASSAATSGGGGSLTGSLLAGAQSTGANTTLDVPIMDTSNLSFSDKRLKNNIKLISVSGSGLNVYSFNYKNKVYGKGKYQGVMSDEVPKSAVIKDKNGYYKVDYSKIDVEFKQI